MRRSFFVWILLSTINAQSQSFHVVLFGGLSNYQGDLQQKRYTFDQSHPAGGLGLLYEITDKLYARANVTYGTISGDDKYSTSILIQERNLNFTTNITDFHLGLEYDIFDLYQTGITPYVFGGISVFHFDPYTKDSLGNTVYLQPLSTEGEGFYPGRSVYKLTQVAIPIGGGIKFALSDNVRIGVEVGFRKLFTDYLDDVSTKYVNQNLLLTNRGAEAVQVAYRGDELKNGAGYPPDGTIRGNPKSKDWYYFSLITVSFRLPSHGNKYNNSSSSKVACPTRVY